MTFRTFLLGLSALFIAAAAAYFSVTGLSKLFAGASLAVILMASSLEFGKLISASFLYVYWNRINKILRTYLLIGVCVLIIITSAGIYGFLTSAYQSTADKLSIIEKQTELFTLKKNRFEDQLISYSQERNTLNQSISELSKGLSNNVIQYRDVNGDMVTTTSSATRKTLEKQLDDAKKQRDVISIKIETLSDSISSLDFKIVNTTATNDLVSEVGPLKYMAEITGKPMSSIVNWFALLIIFVFDPLAVTLVIAFNTALKIDKGEKNTVNYNVYGDSHIVDSTDSTKNKVLADVPNNTVVTSSITNQASATQKSTDTPLLSVDDEPISSTTTPPTEEDIKKWEEYMKSWYSDNTKPPNTDTSIESSESELDELHKQYGKIPVSLNNDGKVDGWDVNGDGLIEKNSYSGNLSNSTNVLPYYARPDFDWNDKTKWINDQSAINYWLTHKKI